MLKWLSACQRALLMFL